MRLPRLRGRRRTRVVMVKSVDRYPAGETVALAPEIAGRWIAHGYCTFAGGARPLELDELELAAERERSQEVTL